MYPKAFTRLWVLPPHYQASIYRVFHHGSSTTRTGASQQQSTIQLVTGQTAKKKKKQLLGSTASGQPTIQLYSGWLRLVEVNQLIGRWRLVQLSPIPTLQLGIQLGHKPTATCHQHHPTRLSMRASPININQHQLIGNIDQHEPQHSPRSTNINQHHPTFTSLNQP